MPTDRIQRQANHFYNDTSRYGDALRSSQQALQIFQQSDDEKGIAASLYNIGVSYASFGEYDKALAYFEQALKLVQKLEWHEKEAELLHNMGGIYYAWSQYPKALDAYGHAMELEQHSRKNDTVSSPLNGMGLVYHARGEYDKALEAFTQVLKLAQESGRQDNIVSALNNMALVYRSWGQYERALDYYQQALTLARQLGREDYTIAQLTGIGGVLLLQGHYEQALAYLREGLELAHKSGRQEQIAVLLNNIGVIYRISGEDERAFEQYEQALQLAYTMGNEAQIVVRLHNIGKLYASSGQYGEALAYYEKSLELSRKLRRSADISENLTGLGIVHVELQKYSKALSYLEESVEIKDQLRKTAAGDVRRDYLASQIETYQLLTACYARTGDVSSAFETIERSRAKLLAEQLAGADDVPVPSFDRIQRSLPDDTAVLMYANTNQEFMLRIIMTSTKISASEHAIPDFVEGIQPFLKPSGQKEKMGEATFRAEPVQDARPVEFRVPEDRSHELEQVIMPYRQLLQETRETTPDLSKSLYALLIGQAEQELQGKTRLLIVPDGILNFLPFETLVNEQGKYLVEQYRIGYVQSLAVWELVRQRKYEQERLPLLAFGGAVYHPQTYQADVIENQAQLAYLQRQVEEFLQHGESLREVYGALGHGAWKNLPGALREVKAIKQVVAGADIMTGDAVSERTIKEFSADGILAEYKVLHFATHGIAVPEMPELSALVLSQGGKNPPLTPPRRGERAEDDGYLRVGEIVKLNVNADLVNLSACETGLGKMYHGEGVVGLTQAFLRAGANGVSVSLWQVSDESTATFMVELYKTVQEQGLSYIDTITAVKRRFIAGEFGESWRAPRYWAPFVYYGQ